MPKNVNRYDHVIDVVLNENDLTTCKQFRDIVGSWNVISKNMSHLREPGRVLMNQNNLNELMKELKKEKLKLPYCIDVGGPLAKQLVEHLWIDEKSKICNDWEICPVCKREVPYFSTVCPHPGCDEAFALHY